MFISKNLKVFFSRRLDRFEITCTSIRKKLYSNPYFFQNFVFCIFEPINYKVIENSCNAPLNLSSLTHIWAKIHFNIIRTKSEKIKLKSGHLELRFSVDYRSYITIIKEICGNERRE